MTLTSARPLEPAPHDEGQLSVQVTRADRYRANLQLSGALVGASAALLAALIENQVQAGRRFLRIDVGGLSDVDRAGAAAFEDAHHRLLSRRGTCILTGATSLVMRVLADAGLDRELFVLAPSADGTLA